MQPEGLMGKKIKFPQFYFMVSGLAAACFAVFFVYWQQNQPVHENKKYIEVPLVAAKSTGEVGSISSGPTCGFEALTRQDQTSSGSALAGGAKPWKLRTEPFPARCSLVRRLLLVVQHDRKHVRRVMHLYGQNPPPRRRKPLPSDLLAKNAKPTPRATVTTQDQ